VGQCLPQSDVTRSYVAWLRGLHAASRRQWSNPMPQHCKLHTEEVLPSHVLGVLSVCDIKFRKRFLVSSSGVQDKKKYPWHLGRDNLIRWSQHFHSSFRDDLSTTVS
jgi:hypothetical protein